ncbi:uncharacterized protein ACWYII_033365 isoform 2-T10 [Salvelinus alpinus]
MVPLSLRLKAFLIRRTGKRYPAYIMALDECITEKELGRVWKKTSGRHNDQCITSNLKVTESEEDLTLVSKQEMQLQLTTANFQIRELKRENAALRQSLSVIEAALHFGLLLHPWKKTVTETPTKPGPSSVATGRDKQRNGHGKMS